MNNTEDIRRISQGDLMALGVSDLAYVKPVEIEGQVPRPSIGSDAFQETPIVEVCRGITKHHYLVTDIAELPRVMKEAFYVATTGRPGAARAAPIAPGSP